jgi:CxxC motif-containing protein (DUF1111 family)
MTQSPYKGKELLAQANCIGCHKVGITTVESKLLYSENQHITPFAEKLLHDVGDGSIGRPDFGSSRTDCELSRCGGGIIEKVNGHTNFLHDGRGGNIQEAVLWHGGEAKNSKEHYASLEKKDRIALLKFLNSL